MKTDSIQHLLEKYREGTLNDEEREELNILTHRDEVMSSARHRASVIQRRTRMGIGFAVTLLVAGGALMWSLAPQHSEGPLMAEAVVPEEVTLPEPEPIIETVAPVEQPAAPVRTHQSHPRHTKTVVAQATPNAALTTSNPQIITPNSEDPVVMCNNQCEADSVINDIWKFLTV